MVRTKLCEIKLIKVLENALNISVRRVSLPEISLSYMEVEAPGNPEHGDYAANAALILAAQAKQNPRKIAQIIQDNLNDPENIIEKTQIAGPGFINFFIKDSAWHQAFRNIEEQKEKYGCLDIGGGKKVQVEFVSANPTAETSAYRPCPRRRCRRRHHQFAENDWVSDFQGILHQ